LENAAFVSVDSSVKPTGTIYFAEHKYGGFETTVKVYGKI